MDDDASSVLKAIKRAALLGHLPVKVRPVAEYLLDILSSHEEQIQNRALNRKDLLARGEIAFEEYRSIREKVMREASLEGSQIDDYALQSDEDILASFDDDDAKDAKAIEEYEKLLSLLDSGDYGQVALYFEQRVAGMEKMKNVLVKHLPEDVMRPGLLERAAGYRQKMYSFIALLKSEPQ